MLKYQIHKEKQFTKKNKDFSIKPFDNFIGTPYIKRYFCVLIKVLSDDFV